MKTVYIPKGHTVCYESLETEHLVVEGCLKTTCGVKAKTITGGGVLSAGTTSADVICLDELETAIPAQLEALRKDLYERALANREKRTWAATTMDQVKELAKANTGYIKTMWCGDLACEMKMKEEVGLSSRCMPFEQEHLSDVCPCCGKPAKTMVYWGVAY
mgnify:FL=1